MKLKINPNKSIGPIEFGMSRINVQNQLSKIDCKLEFERDSQDFFMNSAIQVEYEKDNTVSFIGIASNHNIELLYHNFDLFNLSSEESFNLIASNESSLHTYDEFEYLFKEQIITLYEADTQYDNKGNYKRSVWGQIGLGDNRYLNAINEL
jgi:hypothetical protein